MLILFWQVCHFASELFSVVSFLDDTGQAFDHLFLLDSNDSDYAIYTKEQFFLQVRHSVVQVNKVHDINMFGVGFYQRGSVSQHFQFPIKKKNNKIANVTYRCISDYHVDKCNLGKVSLKSMRPAVFPTNMHAESPQGFFLAMCWPINNIIIHLKSRWIMAEYLPSHEAAR